MHALLQCAQNCASTSNGLLIIAAPVASFILTKVCIHRYCLVIKIFDKGKYDKVVYVCMYVYMQGLSQNK